MNQYEADNKNRLAEETMDNYVKVITAFLAYTDKACTDIKQKDIRNWMKHLEDNGKSPNTIRSKFHALRSFFGYCMDEAVIATNPTEEMKTPLVSVKAPCYLTREQLDRLREIAKSHPRNRAIVETLYTTGVRVSELVSIKLEDVDFSERIIHIRKGKGKRDRLVPFTRECERRILDYLEVKKSDVPWLFVNSLGNKMNRRAVAYCFEKWAKELGFPVYAHMMRHTFAAHLVQKGMPLDGIQTLLGHENREDTLHYARLFDDDRQEIYDHYH